MQLPVIVGGLLACSIPTNNCVTFIFRMWTSRGAHVHISRVISLNRSTVVGTNLCQVVDNSSSYVNLQPTVDAAGLVLIVRLVVVKKPPVSYFRVFEISKHAVHLQG